MEPPASLEPEDIRDEKVKVLRCISPIVMEDTVLGQYGPDPQGANTGCDLCSRGPTGPQTPPPTHYSARVRSRYDPTPAQPTTA